MLYQYKIVRPIQVLDGEGEIIFIQEDVKEKCVVFVHLQASLQKRFSADNLVTFFCLSLFIRTFAKHNPNTITMKFIGIIPARYASTRFPAKPLALLGGKPVIQRVYEQVAGVLDEAYVATDDERIEAAVKAFGGKVVMTSVDHKSGTDRCYEAYCKVGSGYDVVVNKEMKALYFSRSIIPYQRNRDKKEWLAGHTYYKHIGLYAYRAPVLKEITSLPQSSLELAESLEQLRWLENGYSIKVGISEVETIGIDTPQDLARAEEFLRNQQEAL